MNMNTSPLTGPSRLARHLLQPALVQYTLELTEAALQPFDATKGENAAKTACLALQFFIDLLDQNNEAEKQQRDTVLLYTSALKDRPLANPTQVEAHKNESTSENFKLTAVQHVLELPDILGLIVSHIPTLPKSRRQTLHAVALTSRAFHRASDLVLWSHPRYLDTIKQQVQFAFGASISGSLGESLGIHVKRLRIRWMNDGWNGRLIEKIAAICPGIRALTIYRGDSDDELDPVTQESNSTLHSILSSLPNLRHLDLFKFSPTPETHIEFIYPPDAHVPFSKLESLDVYGFAWYWPNISRGLGHKLKSLEIGLGNALSKEQLDTLSISLPSLTALHLSCDVQLNHIQSFVSHAPALEHVEIRQWPHKDDEFLAGALPALTQLDRLKEITLDIPVSTSQVERLAGSPCALQEATIKFHEGISEAECEKALLQLVNSKRQSLTSLAVSFEDLYLLNPSDALITALSNCPRLERMDVEFGHNHAKLSSESVDKLLRQCVGLLPSQSLQDLCEGNELYDNEYKEKLGAAGKEEEERWEEGEDILGNRI